MTREGLFAGAASVSASCAGATPTADGEIEMSDMIENREHAHTASDPPKDHADCAGIARWVER